MRRPSQLWSYIVKYSSITNGTALALALSAMGTSPVIEISASIGKFPIWCFFLGLLASGLHLVTSFVFSVESMRAEATSELARMGDEMNRLRTEALAIGALNREVADTAARLNLLIDNMKELESRTPAGSVGALRHLQEGFLWLAYALFFVGLAVVVWSI